MMRQTKQAAFRAAAVAASLVAGWCLTPRDAAAQADTQFPQPLLSCCGNYARWPAGTNNVTWRLDSTVQTWNSAIGEAAAGWNSVTTSAARIALVADSTPGVSTQNTENEIWFTNTSSGSNSVADMYTRWTTGDNNPLCTNTCTAPTINAADLRFWGKNPNGTSVAWTTTSPGGSQQAPLNSGAVYVPLIAQHEFGHGFGLGHSTYGYDRMSVGYAGWFNVGGGATVFGGDRYWISQLYPQTDLFPAPLVFASNVQYGRSGTTNAAGTGRTFGLSYDRAATSEGTARDAFPRRSGGSLPGRNPNVARVGDAVSWQFCYGNNGSGQTNSVTVTAYLNLSQNALQGAPFGSWTSSTVLQPQARRCQQVTSTVPFVAFSDQDYYILFKTTTSATPASHEVARVDRPLRIVP